MLKNSILIFIALYLAGCSSITIGPKPKKLISSPQDVSNKLNRILGSAVIFVRNSERVAFKKGRKLSPNEMKYANKIGIKYPSKIRIVYQNSFPKPKNKVLLKEFNEFGFGSFFEGGRTTGYGIFIKPFFPKKRSIIRHELVHVGQMETMGIEAFLREYLREAMTYNYLDMPLEKEAFKITKGNGY